VHHAGLPSESSSSDPAPLVMNKVHHPGLVRLHGRAPGLPAARDTPLGCFGPQLQAKPT
jgi:hypothetical protein